MKTTLLIIAVFCYTVSTATEPFMKKGTPEIQSMGTLEINDNGILFIGDSRAGAIYAIDLEDNQKSNNQEAVTIDDLEGQIAGLLGTTADNVLIHDMAVNPISQNIYLSASRGRAGWTSKWHLPNDLANANVLLKIDNESNISVITLEDIYHSHIKLPNPIAEEKEHRWKKGVSNRVDAITSIRFNDNKVYISGLSNEEFAASMWIAPYPFKSDIEVSTLEIFHGAHGKYETDSPIRTFLPYNFDSNEHIIAAYLCTPLVTFETKELKNGTHVKGRTVAEFGSGNYPLDMVAYTNNNKEYILMSNSQLPLLIFDPQDVNNYEGSITEEVEGYLGGVKYTPRSGSGVQQLDDLNEKFIAATQRMPSGKLALVSLSKEWLRP
ncbi:hypothetical protein E1176_09845 [Fulvivirga sp. RKSG066]|uniref:hypothetical protein n=1 Tax=Fulvivirga aurantia TaxID=2529383 RepID=UPI0012BC1673|nr:hypothetical protein [Fulvivirga aurantia]MTI21320.1 hypothetical protein [Fulvivirga aurantia]